MPSRVSRSEPQVFNVSFLDIMACATGAIFFILMVLVLNSALSVRTMKQTEKPPELPPPPDVTTLDIAALKEERDRLRAEEAILDEALAAGSGDLAGPAESLRRAEEARLAEASAALERAGKTISELEEELARADAEAKDLERQIAEGVESGALQKEVRYRIPENRHVEQELGLAVECARNKAYVEGPASYDFYGVLARGGKRSVRPKRIRGEFFWPSVIYFTDLGGFYLSRDDAAAGREVVARGCARKATAKGDDAAVLAGNSSLFARGLAKLDRTKHLVGFEVRPSGIEAFRAAREWTLSNSFLYNWYPYEEDQSLDVPLSVGGGGGSGGFAQ
ncbi:MAG: hypothetical protein HY720_01375 [Planctomycetes bacterium]|nr:hypothetical protein [Planctomycetota bacterium]